MYKWNKRGKDGVLTCISSYSSRILVSNHFESIRTTLNVITCMQLASRVAILLYPQWKKMKRDPNEKYYSSHENFFQDINILFLIIFFLYKLFQLNSNHSNQPLVHSFAFTPTNCLFILFTCIHTNQPLVNNKVVIIK